MVVIIRSILFIPSSKSKETIVRQGFADSHGGRLDWDVVLQIQRKKQ